MKNKFIYIILLNFLFQLGNILAQRGNIVLLKAKAFEIQGKNADAILVLQSEKTSNKKSLQLLANNYFEAGKYAEALRFYLKCDSINPNSVLFEISKCYARAGQTELSQQWLTKYLKQKNKKSEAEIVSDKAFEKQWNTKSWNELWKEEWYSQSEIEINAVKALIRNKEYSKALNRLDISRETITQKSELFYIESAIYFNMKQYEVAMNSIQQAISSNNRNEAFYLLKAQIEMETGKNANALESLAKAIDLNPIEPDYYLQRGKAARLAGNTEIASNDLALYNQLFPESTEGLYQLGKLEAEKGNNLNSISYFSKLVELDQSKTIYFYDFAEIAYKAEKYQLAETNVSMALDINPHSPNSNLLKGKIRLYFSDTKSACGYLRKAMNNNAEAIKLYSENCTK